MSEARDLLWVGSSVDERGDRWFLEVSDVDGGLHWLLLDGFGDTTEEHWEDRDPSDDANWEDLFQYLIKTIPGLAGPDFPDDWQPLPVGAYSMWVAMKVSSSPFEGATMVTTGGEVLDVEQLETFLFGPDGASYT